MSSTKYEPAFDFPEEIEAKINREILMSYERYERGEISLREYTLIIESFNRATRGLVNATLTEWMDDMLRCNQDKTAYEVSVLCDANCPESPITRVRVRKTGSDEYFVADLEGLKASISDGHVDFEDNFDPVKECAQSFRRVIEDDRIMYGFVPIEEVLDWKP